MVGGPWNIQESQADHDHCSDRVYDVVINPADHCVGSGEGSGPGYFNYDINVEQNFGYQ